MLDDLPSTPEEAIARGLNRYFTGERCTRCGQIAPRKLRPDPRGSECVGCIKRRERRRRLRRANENTS